MIWDREREGGRGREGGRKGGRQGESLIEGGGEGGREGEKEKETEKDRENEIMCFKRKSKSGRKVARRRERSERKGRA